jgi:hypothetical protein
MAARTTLLEENEVIDGQGKNEGDQKDQHCPLPMLTERIKRHIQLRL